MMHSNWMSNILKYNYTSRQNHYTLYIKNMNLVIEFIHEHILAIDFAMFVLIWFVQLIAYPAFRYVSEEDFQDWHQKYCLRISYFVLPLMTAQLFEAVAACFFIGGSLILSKAILVVSAWLITFFISAPIHQKLKVMGKNCKAIDRLISTNWYRTVIWTLILLFSFLNY